MTVKHVEGVNKKNDVFLYALSTCIWCKRTRALLEEISVDYDYEYVDLLAVEDKDKAMNEIEAVNPDGGFPTMIINKIKVIVGFKPEEILETLK
ncbi:MAG: glutaredoxin family protein [Endomicrobium sp.]|jgi:glutaredoxin|nr:glutaredoxin family protein [Endomicrobium sp.]